MTGKVEIGGILCVNKEKLKVRGKDRNKDARKEK
jgi:hypothetical protein